MSVNSGGSETESTYSPGDVLGPHSVAGLT